MNSKIKVFWTETEKSKLVEECVRILSDYPEKPILKVIELAQNNTLSEHRRRHIVSLANIPWFNSYLNLKKLELNRKLKEDISDKSEDVENNTYIKSPDSSVSDRVNIHIDLSSVLTEVLKLNSRIGSLEIKLNYVIDLIDSYTSPQKLNKLSGNIKSQLPKVLLIGLLPNQYNDICQEFEGAVEFRLFAANDKMSQLKANVEWADRVISLTSFISHSISETLSNLNINPKNYIRLTGGVSKIKLIIKNDILKII